MVEEGLAQVLKDTLRHSASGHTSNACGEMSSLSFVAAENKLRACNSLCSCLAPNTLTPNVGVAPAPPRVNIYV